MRDVGECLALARYGRLMTLEDVFRTMGRRDWMTGSRVEASRARRGRKAERDDLFSERWDEGLDGLAPADARAAVARVLSD